MFDAEMFGDEMAAMVREFVERATAPLIAENKSLAGQCEALSTRMVALERQLKSAKSFTRKSLDSRFSLDDLSVEQVDDRNVCIALRKGEDIAEFNLTFPVVVDRGAWSDRAEYERGDGVSHGGSWWIARGDNPGRPGYDDGWRLAVKRGRDGRDAGSPRGEGLAA